MILMELFHDYLFIFYRMKQQQQLDCFTKLRTPERFD